MKKNNYIISKKCPIKGVPKKIVSVSPAITEIIFDLDCGNRLIGRTDFCTYPKEVKNIKSIGGINNSNLEMIISMRPDLVITSSIFTKKMFQTIETSGIPIISFKERNTIDGMYDVIRMLGDILDKKDKANEIIDNSKQRLKEIKEKRENINKAKGLKTLPKIYYVVGFGSSGDFSAGKDTYINEIITLAGGDNIAKNSINWSFSTEELFAKQPDYIFVRKEDSASFVNTHPYKELKAVKNKKVYGIDSEIMDIQTPRSIEAIEFISKVISF
jgi:iron complex transport system substrate-binding protein